jgi:hypothetical protein
LIIITIKEIKKSKFQQEKVREVRTLLNNPDKIEEQIRKVERESDENKLNKGLKDKIKEVRNKIYSNAHNDFCSS